MGVNVSTTKPCHPPTEPARDERPPVLIVGCGRSHRRDDQIGLRVAELLQSDPPDGATVILSEAPGPDLLIDAAGVELLIVIDAARREGGRAGQWRRIILSRADLARLDGGLRELQRGAIRSSHLLSVGETLVLGAQLGLLPPEVWVYAIGAADFGYGDQVPGAIQRAIADVAAQLRTHVRDWRTAREERHA
jgi:hydrogenase maturation protease